MPEDQHNPQALLANARSQIHHKLVEEILSLKGVKFQLVLDDLLGKQTPEGRDEENEPSLRSKMQPILIL